MAGSSLTSSTDAGLSSAYGLAAGQVNPGYTSGAGNTSLETVSRSLDVVSAAVDSGSLTLLRCVCVCFLFFLSVFISGGISCISKFLLCCFSGSSAHVGSADAAIQHTSESDPVTASLPSNASAPEVHSAVSTEPTKVSNVF